MCSHLPVNYDSSERRRGRRKSRKGTCFRRRRRVDGTLFAEGALLSQVELHCERQMNGMESAAQHDALGRFNENCKDLFHPRAVAEIAEVPSPLEFHRRWVSPNLPVVVRGGVSHWAAVNKWTHAYLREKIGDLEVTVAVTPNGFADAVHGSVFVTPEERVMKFGEFLDILEGRERSDAVFYIQKQNSNFTDEFRKLAGDVEADVCWATAAFGKTPDAVNFWMGDERAVTSMHRDHYENVYCVVSGHKDFILLPPTDLPWVPYENYKTGQFREVANGQFDVIASGICTCRFIVLALYSKLVRSIFLRIYNRVIRNNVRACAML